MIPTKKDRWVGLEDRPMLADDRQMEKMWKEKPGVHLVNLGEKIRFARDNKGRCFIRLYVYLNKVFIYFEAPNCLLNINVARS